MENKEYAVDSSIKLSPISNYRNYKNIKSFTNFDFCVFVWEYDNKTVFINEFMAHQFSIDLTQQSSAVAVLTARLDDYSLQSFFQAIFEIKEAPTKKHLEFKLKGRISVNWYKLLLDYDKIDNVTIGVVTVIETNRDVQFSYANSKDLFQRILQKIDTPICITDNEGNVNFTNFEVNIVHQRIYNKIEAILLHSDVMYDDIIDIRLLASRSMESEFRVKYVLKNTLREERIIRNSFETEDNTFILYRHKKLFDSSTEQIRLQKIIKANELMMEIKDSIDSIIDLRQMFDYLLSKISTVIPEANRSCVLKRDDHDYLYLDTSFGFDENYVDEFKLPFKESFAYLHLQNDYSKSVIINDIQKKYSDLFIDIKDDTTRFTIESTITAPIVVDDALYGLVSVDSNHNRVFDDVDLYLLDFMKLQIERSIVNYRKLLTMKKGSNEDSLTGVSNRRHLLDMIEYYKEKAQIDHKSLYFVLFDIDELKRINDTYGHVCGDMVLKQFSFVVTTGIRENDFLARIGGDEFVGLFYNISKEVLATRIRKWKKHFEINKIQCNGDEIETKFSFGISEYSEHTSDFTEMMQDADKKLYKQKKIKKKRV